MAGKHRLQDYLKFIMAQSKTGLKGYNLAKQEANMNERVNAVLIKKSPTHGIGVFAARDFKKYEMVCCGNYFFKNINDLNLNATWNSKWTYEQYQEFIKVYNDKDNIRKNVNTVHTSWGSLSSEDDLIMQATRDITKGEELSKYYG